ncbi:TonB-dependent receptor [Sphingomonas oryzagri]
MRIKGFDCPRVVATTSIIAASIFAISTPAFALQQTIVFQIPAQDLGSALRAYARASRQQVAFDAAIVRGKRSAAVVGAFSASAGLGMLLRGSGLNVSRAPSGLLIVKASPARVGYSPNSDEKAPRGATVLYQDTPTSSAASPTAQEGEVPQVEIVVTGTRLKRAGFDTIQPAVVVNAQQIERRGYTNIGQALQELPGFSVAGNSSVGSQSVFGAGQTFVDFFGLGSQRTLTLVNGRRFVSSNTPALFGPVEGGSQVDLNVIPTTLVDRIETIEVGGAPIYGSDAISGTVNVILKRDYQGFEVSGQNGLSQLGDGAEYRVSVLAGRNFADGRGNVTLSGEYDQAEGIPTSARSLTGGSAPFYMTAQPGAAYALQLYTAGRNNAVTVGGSPLVADSIPEFAGVRNAAGQVLIFDNTGNLVPLDFGTRTGSLIFSSGGNGFATGDFANLVTSSKRYLATALASFQATDHVRVFSEGWYSHSSATNLRGQPVYNTALFGAAGTPEGNIPINLDNPYLSAADRATIAANLRPGATQFLLQRANTDLASGASTSAVELYRFVGGLDGDFGLGQRTFKFEASVNYGHSRTSSVIRELVQQNFTNAVDAVRDTAGNITCRPGYTNAAIATFSATCAPLDLFGSGRLSSAALDYITTNARSVSTNSQLVLNANVSGSLTNLPAGSIDAVLGFEHRREATAFDPGSFYLGALNADGTRTQYGRKIPVKAIAGAFHTNEVFGELRLPIISQQMGLRFVHELTLEGSARYVNNSLSGGDITFTGGGRFAPVKDITFRGNFTRAIRSPSISEAFQPKAQAFELGVDPCDSTAIKSGPNPAARATNCAAAGITQPFASNFNSFSIPVTRSGNPDLQNERADSWTAGAVIRPSFIPGLTLAADYVSIAISNAIVSLSGTDILNACYDATSYPNNFCSLVTRSASKQLTGITEGYYNAATLNFSGVTAELSYQLALEKLGLPADAGILGLSVNYLYKQDEYSQVGTGDKKIIAGAVGDPHHSFTTSVNYANGGLNLFAQARYVGESKANANAGPNTYQYPTVSPWVVFNTSIGYAISDKYELRLIVDNIFNRAPPFAAIAADTQNAIKTYYSGLLGRNFHISATARF